MAHDDGLALNTVNRGKLFDRKGQIDRSSLELHLPDPLPDRNLRHFIRVEAKPPVGARFPGRIVGLGGLGRRLAEAEEP